METSLLVLILLIELVMIGTIITPLFFTGRFDSHPNLGIALWFIFIAAAILAALGAVGIATWSIFGTRLGLSEPGNVGFTLAASLAPWILLALAVALMVLTNKRLAPMFQASKDLDVSTMLVSREVMTHRGVQVMELDIPGYLAVTRDKKIYLSKAAFNLPQRQLDVVLLREIGHLKHNHQLVKRIAGIPYQLFPWLAATRALRFEVSRLCDVSADKFALKRVYSKDFVEARRLFTG